MSAFMSNKFLKYRGVRTSEPVTIRTDIPCTDCGYNLRGLTSDRKCPECGRPIKLDVRVPDVLLRGDTAHRKRTRLALGTVAACLIIAALARFFLFIGLIALPWPIAAEGYIGLGLVMSAAWAGAVWMLTTPDLDAALGLPRGLRLIARYSQFLWIVGYACWMLANTIFLGQPSEEQWTIAAALFRAVAGIGSLVFFAMLMVMASHAELEDAARRIHLAIWMLPLPSLILIFIPSTIPWVAVILVGGPLLWWCWCLWMLGRSALMMFGHVAWDLRIEADRPQRQARINATRQKMNQRLSANVRTVNPRPSGDLPVDQ